MAEIIVAKCPDCGAYFGGCTVGDDDCRLGFIGEMVVDALREGLSVERVLADSVTLGGHTMFCRLRPETEEK